MGLMQLMPATAEQFGVTNAFNPAENVRAGVAYLRELLDRYPNNEELALAAYNAGPGAVDKHGQTVPPYQRNAELRRADQQDRRSARSSRAATSIYKATEYVDGHDVVALHRSEAGQRRYEIVGSGSRRSDHDNEAHEVPTRGSFGVSTAVTSSRS